MQKLIKDSQIHDHEAQVVSKDVAVEGYQATATDLLPLSFFLENANNIEAAGVWLDSDEGPEALEPFLEKLNLIAINFPKFADGRGYSYARVLRDRLKFDGDIRAIGDVMRDQMFYLKRCGFSSFALAEGQNADEALEALNDFTESYQSAVDQPTPLFRRR